MVSLSRHSKRAMGYRELGDGEQITATFQVLHLYEVQGVSLEDGSALPIDGAVSGVSYSMAFGSSVNQVARLLADDDYTEDEAEWAKEHRCQPPYLLVKLGPFAPQTCSAGFVNDTGEQISTYDAFSAARQEVREAETRALPPLISGLACRFSLDGPPTRFRRLDTYFYGLTADRRVVRDYRLTASGNMFASRRLSRDEALSAFERAERQANGFNTKVARFFMLALEEEDPLKRFLFFFLSIEIETHAVFGGIDHASEMKNLVNAPDRLVAASTLLFDAQRESWRALKDRFVWCGLCVWSDITDSDVREFSRLKKIRDDIAHGTIAVPPAESVVAVQRLAEKLQALKV